MNSLMEVMLSEVERLLSENQRRDWTGTNQRSQNQFPEMPAAARPTQKYYYKTHQEMNPGMKTALLLGAGFVVGCHLGSHFLTGFVVLVMIGLIVHHCTH